MSVDISSIVELNINLQTGAVEKAGFSVLLLASPHVGFLGRTATYTDNDLSDDHFTDTCAVQKAVTTYFNQKPKPGSVIVARRKVLETYVRVATVLDDTEYVVTVNDVDYSFTSGTGTTDILIAAGLVTAINIGVASLTTDNTDGTFTVDIDKDGDGTYAVDVDDTYLVMNVPYNVTIDTWADLTTYTHTINDTTFSVAVSTTPATDADVAAAMVAAINAGSEPVTAKQVGVTAVYNVISDTDMSEITSDVEVTAGTGTMSQARPGITETWATCLNAIYQETKAWYGLAIQNRNTDEQLAVADWIESKPKMFGCSSGDSELIDTVPASDTTSIAAQVADASYDRTWVIYHADAWGDGDDDWADVAWFGRMLTFDPDVETASWANWSLTGPGTDDLTSTQMSNTVGDMLEGTGGKGCNVYVEVGAESWTLNGKTCNGEWIDIILGRDWLYARITETITQILANNKKIAYTNTGIALIASAVTQWLAKGIETEFLYADLDTFGVPGFSVTFPTRAQALTADVANRVLRGVKGECSVAGAIHAMHLTINIGV